jgi:DNA-binding MltR family transcriptional regulator
MTKQDDGRRIAFMVGGYNPKTKAFTDFLEDFNKESDRGAVLSAAAYIDDLLRQTISSFLVEGAAVTALVDNGALSTFSARIMTAHALGLISDDEKGECTAIRNIRNKFAHKVKMSFQDAEVEGFCSGLRLVIKPVDGTKPNTRMKFTSAAVTLISLLRNRADHASKNKLKYQQWPT